jgi:hypothetical protein
MAEMALEGAAHDLSHAAKEVGVEQGTAEAERVIGEGIAEAMGLLEGRDVWLGVLRLASALYNRTPKSRIGYREARRIFFGEAG